MGVKAFKEHYKIGHIVQKTDEGICIGSPYVHALITVGFDGTVIHRSSISNSDELNGYVKAIESDTAKSKSLIEQEDRFGELVTIWTYTDGDIIEKQCEVPEWPNTTTDGQIIYANSHSTDRTKVVEMAKSNALSRMKLASERVEEHEESLDAAKIRLAESYVACSKLGIFMFEVGKNYKTKIGETVSVVGRSAKKPGYETVICSDGKHRYDRSGNSGNDAGRVTGTVHDYSCPDNFILTKEGKSDDTKTGGNF